MPWDSSASNRKMSNKKKAEIVEALYRLGATQTCIHYFLGGLYVKEYSRWATRDALERVRACDASAVVPKKGIWYKKVQPKAMNVRREHNVPVSALQEYLNGSKDRQKAEFIEGIMDRLFIAIITNEEDEQLRTDHFAQKMPEKLDKLSHWTGFERYDKAGIKLEDTANGA